MIDQIQSRPDQCQSPAAAQGRWCLTGAHMPVEYCYEAGLLSSQRHALGKVIVVGKRHNRSSTTKGCRTWFRSKTWAGSSAAGYTHSAANTNPPNVLFCGEAWHIKYRCGSRLKENPRHVLFFSRTLLLLASPCRISTSFPLRCYVSS